MAIGGRHQIEFNPRAERELRKLPRRDRDAIASKLDELATIPQPGNLNVERIRRRQPWLRLRVGDFRVLFRALTPAEIARLVARRGVLAGPTGYLVERVVNKADVGRAIDKLELEEIG